MKATNWICGLLALYICLSEAKNKIRRPLPPSYSGALIWKKPRPIAHRISMGNTIHVSNNLSPQRIPYKYINYRIRRPPAIYNVLPAGWKNQIPIRTTLNNRVVLPQRTPVKEFHSVNQISEYSPEYRPELVMMPATHRGGIDDDKGPIHTIPAPNLSLADKPYKSTNSEEIANRRPYSNDVNYHTTAQNLIADNVGLVTIGNNLPPQKTVTTSTTPQHQYEVTESNDAAILKEHQTAVQSATLQPQNLDITRLYSTIINPHLQPNELFVNPINTNAGVVGPNMVQFGQTGVPMQTNLHSSLHVGFPAVAVQTPYTVAQQIPDLHVGHPAPAGPPLSATQLYDLLNSFPHKLAEQYTSANQRNLIQQQFGEILQPDMIASFSQPQMHSFNYDEQANQLQQQQQQQQEQKILLDQNYASESVTADYNFGLESSADVKKQNEDVRTNGEFTYPVEGGEQLENNIAYEEKSHRRSPLTYFEKAGNLGSGIPTKFYTTLPNREAAEKLAALAAAGNVNSRLIVQLQKQQDKNTQKDETIPANHKNDDSATQRIDDDQLQFNQHKSHRKNQQQNRKQSLQNDEKLPLQITIPEEDDYIIDNQESNVKKDNINFEYEYEDGEGEESQFSASLDEKTISYDDDTHLEFGSRLRSKN